MYPNPQDALPLPSRPSIEQYRKRAKELVKACQSGDPAAIRSWAAEWLHTLAALRDESDRRGNSDELDRDVRRVAEFARAKLAPESDGAQKCVLADAQFVIARAHGFLSWPKLAAHLESLAHETSPVSAFEAAADAIVAGDASALERLLQENAGLIRARSTREHNATLLHYVSANGVEGYRQRSPKNAAQITRLLLRAGADVDAEADVYGGGCTTLGLVATSTPPHLAGVQLEVIDVLLEQGARMDHPGCTGNRSALIRGCLANGCPEAAAHLSRRGAPLDLMGAAGTGNLDAVKRFFQEDGRLTPDVTEPQMQEAYGLAAAYGHAEMVDFLLDHGFEVDAELRVHGEGHTALHVACYHGHADIVRSLLRRGARVDVRDKTWGTPPLTWALTGWSHVQAAPAPFHEIVVMLVAAGSEVKAEWLDWDKVRADPTMHAALTRKLKVENNRSTQGN